MKPLFMQQHDVADLEEVEPVEGKHYTYCNILQRARWNTNAPTMSTTQSFSGRHSISDDSHSDSE